MSTHKTLANRIIKRCNSWADFVDEMKPLKKETKKVGDCFERLTQVYLQTKSEYVSLFKNVWWLGADKIPAAVRKKLTNLPNPDEGIDLVAETHNGEFWAIQSKYKSDSTRPPTRKDLTTFTDLTFQVCKGAFEQALVVHSADRPIRKRHLLPDKLIEFGLERWLELTDEHWQIIKAKAAGRSRRPKRRTPRPHQRAAIEDAKRHFITNKKNRGKLIMPCGTGKSLTAFWIAQELKAKTIVVVVPSLILLKKGVEDWLQEFIARNNKPLPEWICVCSDKTVGKSNDSLVNDVYESGLDVKTDAQEIAKFLRRRNKAKRVIFVTYQSSPVFAQAAKLAGRNIDFAILDEAHKTAGVKGKAFSTLLFDANLKIKKRMFMTATERTIRGSKDEVVSMDSEDDYGKTFHSLSFKAAIEADPPIISDYKIVTMCVSDSEIAEIVKKRAKISNQKVKIEEEDARFVAAGIALRKAYKKYGIKHAVSFHRSIKSADDFRELHSNFNDEKLLNPKVESFHISSQKTAGQRTALLNDFSQSNRALITNARCLTEGVDVPAIDCVLFADPKHSTVDIVQAAGRAMRISAGKQFGFIMLPIIVPDDIGLENFLESSDFKSIGRVVVSLSQHDQRIVEELRAVTSGASLSQRIFEVVGFNRGSTLVELDQLKKQITLKVWNRVGRCNWLPYEDARSIVRQLNFTSVRAYTAWARSEGCPPDIPITPQSVYSSQDFDWNDYLGSEVTREPLGELDIHEVEVLIEDFHLTHGRYPNTNADATVKVKGGETWLSIDYAGRYGRRGMPKGKTLSVMCGDLQGLASANALTTQGLKELIEKFYETHKKYPSGSTSETSGHFFTWEQIDGKLKGGTFPNIQAISLSKFKEEFGLSDVLEDISLDELETWMQTHYTRTGRYPSTRSGFAPNGEKWGVINDAGKKGERSLPKGSTLQSIRDRLTALPSSEEIIEKIRSFNFQNARLPTVTDKVIAWGEITWQQANQILRQRLGISLSQFKKQHNVRELLNEAITEAMIIRAIWLHLDETGYLPHSKSLELTILKNTWHDLNAQLKAGELGSEKGTTLETLIDKHGLKSQGQITVEETKVAIETYFKKNLKLPTKESITDSGLGVSWCVLALKLQSHESSSSNKFTLQLLVNEFKSERVKQLSKSSIEFARSEYLNATGGYPHAQSGMSPFAILWQEIDRQLQAGKHGYPKNTTLAALDQKTKISKTPARNSYTEDEIVKAMIKHKETHGKLPSTSSRTKSSLGKNWSSVDRDIRSGNFGLPKGTTLSSIKKRNKDRLASNSTKITIQNVKTEIRKFYKKHKKYPAASLSEKTSFGLSWKSLDCVMRDGRHGFTPGTTLSSFKDKYGFREKTEYLTEEEIIDAMREYRVENGELPTTTSEDDSGLGLTWKSLNGKLQNGTIGPPKGTTLISLQKKSGLFEHVTYSEEEVLASLQRYIDKYGSLDGIEESDRRSSIGPRWVTLNVRIASGEAGFPKGTTLSDIWNTRKA